MKSRVPKKSWKKYERVRGRRLREPRPIYSENGSNLLIFCTDCSLHLKAGLQLGIWLNPNRGCSTCVLPSPVLLTNQEQTGKMLFYRVFDCVHAPKAFDLIKRSLHLLCNIRQRTSKFFHQSVLLSTLFPLRDLLGSLGKQAISLCLELPQFLVLICNCAGSFGEGRIVFSTPCHKLLNSLLILPDLIVLFGGSLAQFCHCLFSIQSFLFQFRNLTSCSSLLLRVDARVC